MDPQFSILAQPEELKWEFALRLDQTSLIQLCATHPDFYGLCDDHEFLIKWVRIHSPELFSLVDRYEMVHLNLSILACLDKVKEHVRLGELVTVDSFKYYSLSRCCLMAGRQQDMDLFLFYISTLSDLWSNGAGIFLQGLLESRTHLIDEADQQILSNQEIDIETFIDKIINYDVTLAAKAANRTHLMERVNIIVQTAIANTSILTDKHLVLMNMQELFVYYHGLNETMLAMNNRRNRIQPILLNLFYSDKFLGFLDYLETHPWNISYYYYYLLDFLTYYTTRSKFIRIFNFIKLYAERNPNYLEHFHRDIFHTGDASLILDNFNSEHFNFNFHSYKIISFSSILLINNPIIFEERTVRGMLSEFISLFLISRIRPTLLISNNIVSETLKIKFSNDQLFDPTITRTHGAILLQNRMTSDEISELIKKVFNY